MSELQIFFQEPCPENWDKMTECGRSRFCDKCKKHVHDLTMYTPEEVAQLLLGGDEPACIRATTTHDGNLVTKPSAYGRTLSALVITPALFSALSAAAADYPEEGSIVGQFLQERGNLTIQAEGEGSSSETKLDGDGYFRFSGLRPGLYTLRYVSNGAVIVGIEKIQVLAGQAVQSRGGAMVKVQNRHGILNPPPPPSPPPTAGVPVMILPAKAKSEALAGARAANASASKSAAPVISNPKP